MPMSGSQGATKPKGAEGTDGPIDFAQPADHVWLIEDNVAMINALQAR